VELISRTCRRGNRTIFGKLMKEYNDLQEDYKRRLDPIIRTKAVKLALAFFGVFICASYLSCATHLRSLPGLEMTVLLDTNKSRSEIVDYVRSRSIDSGITYSHDTAIGIFFYPVFLYGYPGELYISKWLGYPGSTIADLNFSWRLTPSYIGNAGDTLVQSGWNSIPHYSSFNFVYDSLCTSASREFHIPFDAEFSAQDHLRSFHFHGGTLRIITDTVINWHFARKKLMKDLRHNDL
jgi:hypothetical protein